MKGSKKNAATGPGHGVPKKGGGDGHYLPRRSHSPGSARLMMVLVQQGWR